MSLFCRTLLLALLGLSLSGCVVYEHDRYPRHGYYYGWGYPAPHYHGRYYYDDDDDDDRYRRHRRHGRDDDQGEDD